MTLFNKEHKFFTGNEILVASQESKGSSFQFCISTGIATQTNERKRKKMKLADSDPGLLNEFSKWIERSRILIVDDEAFCVDVLVQFAKKMKFFEIAIAPNGLEAIRIIDEKAKWKVYFEVILMDCNMPVMNGLVTSDKICKMISDKQIPFLDIIAATANIGTADEETCLKAGLKYYLGKPIAFKTLYETLFQVFLSKNDNS